MRDDRLIGDPQLALVDRLAKVVLEHLAVRCLRVHGLLVEAVLAAARVLGRVEREIGVADQAVGSAASRIADGDADRCADDDPVPFDAVGPRNLLDHGPGERFQKSDVDLAREHGLELVAAEAADLSMITHRQFQPVRDLPEQCVADRVAERVVDVLEAVEIDQEERAAFLPARRVAKRLVERLPHHRPVRQSGQRIEACKPRDFLLGPALLGEVGADAAKAEEAAALVEDRVAGKRPVNVLVAGRRHDDVGEREARGEVETERLAVAGLGRQQVGKLPAQELRRFAAEVVGKLLRDVGERAFGVGFPEPAAAAVFELLDEVERLARLGIEVEPAGGRPA